MAGIGWDSGCPQADCGGLNENGPHRLTGLKTGKWYHLKGLGGVALLEEGCHWVGSEVSRVSLFLLPVDLDVELSATAPAPCLPVYSHASCHDDNGLHL